MPNPPAKPDQKPYQPPDSLKVPVHVKHVVEERIDPVHRPSRLAMGSQVNLSQAGDT